MNFDVMAFAANFCHLGDYYSTTARMGNGIWSYLGLAFLRTFVDPHHPSSEPSLLSLVFVGAYGARLTTSTYERRKPLELVLNYHVRHVARKPKAVRHGGRERRPPIRLILNRRFGSIRGSKHRAPHQTEDASVELVEVVSSVSLSLLNTSDAPYTIVVLADNPGRLLDPLDRALRRPPLGPADKTGDSDTVPPDSLDGTSGKIDRLRPGGRCAGMTQFLRTMLAVFRRWEADLLDTVRAIDLTVDFSVSLYT